MHEGLGRFLVRKRGPSSEPGIGMLRMHRIMSGCRHAVGHAPGIVLRRIVRPCSWDVAVAAGQSHGAHCGCLWRALSRMVGMGRGIGVRHPQRLGREVDARCSRESPEMHRCTMLPWELGTATGERMTLAPGRSKAAGTFQVPGTAQELRCGHPSLPLGLNIEGFKASVAAMDQ